MDATAKLLRYVGCAKSLRVSPQLIPVGFHAIEGVVNEHSGHRGILVPLSSDRAARATYRTKENS